MVDRGGLNYPIRVRDEFSKTTALFRKEIRAAKKEFRDFQKVLKGRKSSAKNIRDQTKATKELAKAQRQLTKNTKAGNKPLSKREKQARETHRANKRLSRSIDQLSKSQKQRERTAIALRNAQNADARREAARLKSLERQAVAERKASNAKNVEFQATRKLNQELFREAVARKQIELLKRQARAQFAAGDFSGGTETLRRSRALEKSLKAQVGSAQKLLFTFRRLVGTLAIFTLARKGVQVFNDLVRAGVKFNDVVANAQLGIAGLVITLGDVRNAQGQSVEATEQLALALGTAREQTAKLRQDSLKTVATFEQLLDTFQVSVGPGLAAGLNLDEVRKLTVDISQAAAALGVPQNQLAEEVRSLLSGTIQARTTRIATALGISNEDVRRLKETGELFDFLEEKFSGFAEAAQKQARTTFSGITTLVKGLVQEVLGEAARPLFQELISLGNELFDNFLSITDAAGNVKPSPEVVAAFQQVFDAIKRTVEAVRELGSGGGGLTLLSATMSAIANTIDFVRGALVQLISVFQTITGASQEFSKFLGISSKNTGAITASVGKWLVNILLIQKALSVIDLKMLKIAARVSAVAVAFFAIAKASEFVLEKIFGVDLGIRDTIELITIGLYSAWIGVTSIVQEVAIKAVNFLANALDTIITAAKNKASSVKGFLNALFGDDKGAQAAAKERLDRELEATNRIADRKAKAALEVAAIELNAKAKQKALEGEIAKVIGDRADENAKGEGFREGFDPKAAAKAAADAAKTFVSTAKRSISDLGASLKEVNDELVLAEQLFSQATRSSGVGGIAGDVESAFDEEEIARAGRLRKIKADLVNVEKEITRLRAIGPEAEGALNSALQDQKLLQVAILNSEEQSLGLARLKAATLAEQELPALREESVLLAAQVAVEAAKTAALKTNAGNRQLALVAAQSSLDLAKSELAATKSKNELELQTLKDRALELGPGAELTSLIKVISALSIRQGFEEEILRLRTEQLAKAQEEANLVANGSLTDGLKEGFMEFAEQFGSTFNAGMQIARQSTAALASFISREITAAFDPTVDSTLEERFARFMQSVANIILQQLIQVAIAKGIKELGFATTKAATEATGAAATGAVEIATAKAVAFIQVTTAQTIAAIRVASGGGGGLAQGGLVPRGFAKGGMIEHATKAAQPFARGGFSKPSHIPASDTIPAWLTPGEFVMRKSVVENLGLPLLEAMNGGNMPVVGSYSAEAAGPSTGMQSGGLVADQIASAAIERGSGEEASSTVVVPAIVARDGEMDKLTAGGRNAMLAFMRENAGNINSLLDRSNGRG